MGWPRALAVGLLLSAAAGRSFLAQPDATTTSIGATPGGMGAMASGGAAAGNATNATGACATGVCEQLCAPTDDDGFACSCYPGYTLHENGEMCVDDNECTVNNGGCLQECINLPGGHMCACSEGYKFNLTNGTCPGNTCMGVNCIDIDECANKTDSCEHQCTNTQGSYLCSCNEGFFLEPNRFNCSDLDECPGVECEHYCENLVGSFQCHCYHGYAMVDNHCEDIDECTMHNGGCAHKCINTPGSHMCACEDGYHVLFDDCLQPLQFVEATGLLQHVPRRQSPRRSVARSSSALLQRLRKIARV